jgi:hypothetical protein
MALPGRTKETAIWRAYQGHNARTRHSVQPEIMGWVEQAVLDGIEARALLEPDGAIAASHREMLRLLRLPDLHQRPQDRGRVAQLYLEVQKSVFPASCAYVDHSQRLTGITLNLSLVAVELDVLRDIDLRAHQDPAYRTFVRDMTARLAQAKSAPDVVAYSQFFETYAEAMTLRFLRDRGIPTKRIEDTVSAPDFECTLADGRPYFVEVKALEIVGGSIRQTEIMTDGLDTQLEIERQLKAGRQIASASGEIAPYRKPHTDLDYDPRSLKRVIDTLRDKSRQAFKPSQFERGPTFALVVADRLILDGWKSALAPFYYNDHTACCVSGVIWQAAFGRLGTPVLRRPDFEGRPTVESYLDKDGLYVDAGLPFAGVGLVVLQRSSKRRLSYGLAAPTTESESWSQDDTEEALGAMYEAWNDAQNRNASRLSRYEIEL